MRLLSGIVAFWPVALLLLVASASPLPDCNGEPRKFELTLTWEKHAPDGFEREMALINGGFPGPLMEINEGDDVEVLVHNKMPYNTTIHFHGIEMEGTPWSDGVPGLTQRQIKPGNSFVYKWKATQYGSYWYHAHQRGQIDDGLYGPLVIHPRKTDPKPFSLITEDPKILKAMIKAEEDAKPLVLSDLRHITSEENWKIEIAAGIETPCYDSILINGKGRVQCWSKEKIASLLTPDQKTFLKLGNETALTAKACLSGNIIGNVLAAGLPTNLSAVPPEIFDVCTPTNAPQEVIEVTKSKCSQDKWVAFNVIATFGLITGSFSIDGHPMFVYAVDGSYIEPQLVHAITVTNGDRFSVMVKVDKAGDYSIRIASTATAQMITGVATLSIRDTKEAGANATSTGAEPYINDVGLNTTSDVVFFNQGATRSFPPDVISPVADRTFKLSMKVAGASYNWALNSTIYPMQLDNEAPLLFEPDPSRHNNVTISTCYGEWVDLVFVAVSFPMPPHPIHKHGNKMWLLGHGDGEFPYASVAEAAKAMPGSFNLVNPPKRDGLSTPPATTGPAWMAVRYHVTNPGAWFLHCHIQSHLLGGMSMAIQDGVDRWPVVPKEYLDYH